MCLKVPLLLLEEEEEEVSASSSNKPFVALLVFLPVRASVPPSKSLLSYKPREPALETFLVLLLLLLGLLVLRGSEKSSSSCCLVLELESSKIDCGLRTGCCWTGCWTGSGSWTTLLPLLVLYEGIEEGGPLLKVF
jgi:hypothetical protein